MNIIETQRENIRRENNTAQDELMGIIEGLSKSVSELSIQESLHGDLDFAYLGERGFNHIKTIELGEGEITSIKNLPETVRTFICSRNLLTDVEGLPRDLEKLVCEDNYLQNFDGKSAQKIKVLHLANNKLTEITNLPEDLEELYVDNNQLRVLDLENCQKLRLLRASNNHMLVIEHVPASLVDIQSENTPFAEYEVRAQNDPVDENPNQKIDYIDSLHDYFKLKQKYETALHQQRKTIFREAATKSIGRKMLKQVKPKCINCKRPVGTIFELKEERYVAMCGDPNRATKCNLDIQLYRGGYSNEEYMTYLFKEQTESAKETIVKQKLELIFNYVGEGVAAHRFKKNIENYTSDSSMYKSLLDNHNQLYYNTERDEQVLAKIEKIEKITTDIKHMIEEYQQNNNKETLRDAVQMQIRELHPEIENLRRLRYSMMETENQVIMGGGPMHPAEIVTCTLFQKEIALQDIDYTFGERSRVMKYITSTGK